MYLEATTHSLRSCFKGEIKRYRVHCQEKDEICSSVGGFCKNSWPAKSSNLSTALQPYWEAQSKLTLSDGLPLYGRRIQQCYKQRLWTKFTVVTKEFNDASLELAPPSGSLESPSCRKSGPKLQELCWTIHSPSWTNDHFLLTGLSLAESRLRHVFPQWSHIPARCRPLFTIPGDNEVDNSHIQQRDRSSLLHVLEVWDPTVPTTSIYHRTDFNNCEVPVFRCSQSLRWLWRVITQRSRFINGLYQGQLMLQKNIAITALVAAIKQYTDSAYLPFITKLCEHSNDFRPYFHRKVQCMRIHKNRWLYRIVESVYKE